MTADFTAAPRSDLERLSAQLDIPAAAVKSDLLRLAFIDISSSADENNEKLEFLGDAALRLAAGEFLMETYPQMSLGEMSAVRSHLVSDQVLAGLAEHYRLGRYLVLVQKCCWRQSRSRFSFGRYL